MWVRNFSRLLFQAALHLLKNDSEGTCKRMAFNNIQRWNGASCDHWQVLRQSMGLRFCLHLHTLHGLRTGHSYAHLEHNFHLLMEVNSKTIYFSCSKWWLIFKKALIKCFFSHIIQASVTLNIPTWSEKTLIPQLLRMISSLWAVQQCHSLVITLSYVREYFDMVFLWS